MKLANRRFILPALFLTLSVSIGLTFGSTNRNPKVEAPPTAILEPVNSTPVAEATLTESASKAIAEEEADGKVAIFTLRPNGFQPAEITIPAGKYLVIVRNRTGLDKFSFRLERGSGARLHDVRMPRYKREWKQFLQLAPDTYVITESDHPGWVCRITVTAD